MHLSIPSLVSARAPTHSQERRCAHVVQKMCPHIAAMGVTHGSSLQILQCHAGAALEERGIPFAAVAIFEGLGLGVGVATSAGTVPSVSEPESELDGCPAVFPQACVGGAVAVRGERSCTLKL